MFSGVYLKMFTRCMVPSDRIAQLKGCTSLGTSLPEDGNG
jgi:hypothetical protein